MDQLQSVVQGLRVLDFDVGGGKCLREEVLALVVLLRSPLSYLDSVYFQLVFEKFSGTPSGSKCL
jgi:hypothetical protein